METEYLIGVLFGVAVCTILGGMIGENRGRAGAGAFCGFLLGPLGVVIAFFLPREEKADAVRTPGSPTNRKRALPVKQDPLEAWEMRERAKSPPPVPEHFRERKLDGE